MRFFAESNWWDTINQSIFMLELKNSLLNESLVAFTNQLVTITGPQCRLLIGNVVY